MKTNKAIEAFYRVKRIELPDLTPLPFKYVWNTIVLPRLASLKGLPRLNPKPRKTTYKTVKRFSAKRNR